jgi:hypothetical protein
MTSGKSVTGNIALLSNALVMLGTYNLTMTGSISGGSSTSHIVTNSSGQLVMNNVGAFPSFSVFPIGANTTTMNAMAIANGEGLNYGARVEVGINPVIAIPVSAVNRTWVVRPSGTPAGTVNVNFIYSTGDGNALFNYAPATVELGFYNSVWNVINTGLVQAGGPPNYQVAGTTNIFASNTDAAMVIANIGAILAVNNSVQLTAQKQNGQVILNWSVLNTSTIDRFVVERSADGRTYTLLATVASTSFDLTDGQALPGLNYYRVKMLRKDGKITCSNIAVILNAAKGTSFISIAPNPVVNGNFKLNVSAAQNTKMEMLITDMQGRKLRQQVVTLIAGFNQLPVNVNDLSPGIYLLYAIIAGERSRVLRFEVQ